MTTQVNTKVRLVKCPKCRKLLAELPDIAVYKCGGCGTVLQAKIRKLETTNSELSSQETVSASTSQHDDVSNHDLKVESSPDSCVSDGISSSRDIISPRSEDSSLKVKESPEYNPLGRDPEEHQSKLHDERTADPSFSNELSSSCEITRGDEAYAPEASEHVEKHQDNRADTNEDDESQRVLDDGDNLVDEVQNLSEHDQQDNCAPSENGEKSHACSADQNGELADENGGTPRGGESHRASQSLVSFYLTTDDEHLDHSPSRGARNFNRVSSIDTLASSHQADPNSELNFGHGSITNFPTNGSYYAYDGSESSYDGTDYQTRERISHPLRKNRGLDYTRPSEVLRKNGFNVVNSKPERAYWGTSSPHHAPKNSHWNQGTSTETNRYNNGRRMRFDNRDDVSGLPFTSRTSGYPPRQPSYTDPEKIDLLRTVYELKDQLKRMQFPKVSSNQRFPNREKYAELSHLGGYNRVNACDERCNASRLAFSGEAAHYRRPVSCSCLHYSAQLQSCSMHGHHVVHTDHNSYNVSNSPSPHGHHYTSTELSLYDTKSENQRLDEIKRLHLTREKYHTAKRHLRPVAGGAPFVACYHCSEVLQLPVDFLLFKKRYHKLKCNGCKKVLKFSLLKGTHIVPYDNDASAPPPSEADDFNHATSQDPPSRSTSCHHVDPVSYSDDYGRSFCRSCSTEEEALGVAPSFDQVQQKSYNRKMSSGSSPHQPMEDRKMKGVLMDSSNSVESVGHSPRTRKFTSEIEEVVPSSTSPLHRLMGYPSPSHVLSR